MILMLWAIVVAHPPYNLRLSRPYQSWTEIRPSVVVVKSNQEMIKLW
jgi:hypothetical protein